MVVVVVVFDVGETAETKLSAGPTSGRIIFAQSGAVPHPVSV